MTVRRALALLLLIPIAGCGFMRRTQSRFYSLDTVPRGAEAAAVAGVPVAIDVVELPPGFDRREIVVRQADLRLEVRESDQWTASLEPLVLHTLAFDLADRLPVGMVILPGQVPPDTGRRAIDLVFEDLGAGPGNAINVDVRWVVRQAGAPDRTHHERFEVPLQSLDSGNIATGMSQALATLADRIVAGL
jgi:uncharacterized lipoprotein YmbA